MNNKLGTEKLTFAEEKEFLQSRIAPLEKQVSELEDTVKITEAKLKEAVANQDGESHPPADGISPVQLAELEVKLKSEHDSQVKALQDESEKQFNDLMELQKAAEEEKDDLNAQIERVTK